MATATCQLSEHQLLCSICLDVFTDPVTSPCGHNFCKTCIDQHWSADAKCQCPHCKHIFPSRPELKINTFISEVVDQVRQSHLNSTASAEAQAVNVLCDVCSGPKQQALKSCLVCLSSYCESHLEPHLKTLGLRKHKLVEPKKDLEERVCREHDKPLELFCKSDQQTVCVDCMGSDHKDHKVIHLKEASEQHRRQLQITEAKIQLKISLRMKKIGELLGSVRDSDAAADRQISDGVQVFNTLKESVETGLDLLISEVTGKKTATKQQAEGLIQELKREISALEKREAEVKLLSKSDDPLHMLRHSSQLGPRAGTKDWTHVTVPPPVYEGAVETALTLLEQDFNKKTKNMFKLEVKRVTASPPHRDRHPLDRRKTLGSAPSKKDKKTKDRKKRLSQGDIDAPRDFQHIIHVGKVLDRRGFEMRNVDSELKEEFGRHGITENLV